ncbi:hypothetical protein AMTR_s00037p00162070 [Amborella trichopoda]|uniref:Uncharacterized protein n=1 Tax=Amborella trichopoda TaxID=13333 RepID=U5D552_AMBTC|nr:hypothetical protein AMTR_s00037p00162070 [Amborella trichopoda]
MEEKVADVDEPKDYAAMFSDISLNFNVPVAKVLDAIKERVRASKMNRAPGVSIPNDVVAEPQESVLEASLEQAAATPSRSSMRITTLRGNGPEVLSLSTLVKGRRRLQRAHAPRPHMP